jgi:hypothetical protein
MFRICSCSPCLSSWQVLHLCCAVDTWTACFTPADYMRKILAWFTACHGCLNLPQETRNIPNPAAKNATNFTKPHTKFRDTVVWVTNKISSQSLRNISRALCFEHIPISEVHRYAGTCQRSTHLYRLERSVVESFRATMTSTITRHQFAHRSPHRLVVHEFRPNVFSFQE